MGIFRAALFEMGLEMLQQKESGMTFVLTNVLFRSAEILAENPRCSPMLQICWLFSLRKTVNIDWRYTEKKMFRYVDKEIQNNLFAIIFGIMLPGTTLGGA